MRKAIQEMLCEAFEIRFPYVRMGAVDSLDLFGFNELAIFAFYRTHRNRYRTVRDIGANLGLHSIMMTKLGWEVIAYEPDPHYYKLMRANFDENGLLIGSSCAAISDKVGEAEFVRVLGNATGSHLAGDKEPHGFVERFNVMTLDARDVLDCDFAKLDCEGAEARILMRLEPGRWQDLEAMIEVGNPQNAELLFGHFQKHGIMCWSQKTNWQRVTKLADMPKHHTEGSLFVGHHNPFPLVP